MRARPGRTCTQPVHVAQSAARARWMAPSPAYGNGSCTTRASPSTEGNRCCWRLVLRSWTGSGPLVPLEAAAPTSARASRPSSRSRALSYNAKRRMVGGGSAASTSAVRGPARGPAHTTTAGWCVSNAAQIALRCMAMRCGSCISARNRCQEGRSASAMSRRFSSAANFCVPADCWHNARKRTAASAWRPCAMAVRALLKMAAASRGLAKPLAPPRFLGDMATSPL
mmetsp:Transcript_107969/g.186238  ORF Transcript_107969/g.186238 Transcript_107969/m.186238 type:complete len:226 (-) Transcript_107969:15-692(-)